MIDFRSKGLEIVDYITEHVVRQDGNIDHALRCRSISLEVLQVVRVVVSL